MTLLVQAPPQREPERRYILDVVLADRLGLDWQLVGHHAPDMRIRLDGEEGGPVVSVPDVLLAIPEDRWLTAAALPASPLPRLPVGDLAAGSLEAAERLPVVYGRADAGRLADIGPEGVTFHLDLFGAAFAQLTRYEEVVDGPRDRYDRYPAARSLAAREGFLGLPLVDAYVELLWSAFVRTWPRLRRRSTAYAVTLTHDVDDPLSTLGRGPALLARQFAGDVVRRRNPGLLMRRAAAVLAARRGRHERDPHATFDFLADVSERHGLRSAFYFLAHNDVDPALPLLGHPWVCGLVGHVHRRGHEVGLHAGFGTYRDADRTAQELRDLRAVAERAGVQQEAWGGRQHYLQWTNPQTWRNWDDAGLQYDCTLSFSEAPGFRTGTCHPYRAFDLVRRRPLALVERPFQVMDVTLFGDLGLSPDAAHQAVLDIARECRRFAGTLGVLWHNDEVLRTTRQKRWYAALVADVV
jgi:hypothetical protein